jgi:sRNA-binding protein
MPDKKQPNLEGEVAGRRFQEAERSFAEKDPVERKPREAARRETGEGKFRHRDPAAHHAGDASKAHTEENLDHGLEETFPASDPVSISPGAD